MSSLLNFARGSGRKDGLQLLRSSISPCRCFGTISFAQPDIVKSIILEIGNCFCGKISLSPASCANAEFTKDFSFQYALPAGEHQYLLCCKLKNGDCVQIESGLVSVDEKTGISGKMISAKSGIFYGTAFGGTENIFKAIEFRVASFSWQGILMPKRDDSACCVECAEFKAFYTLPHGEYNYEIWGTIQTGEVFFISAGRFIVSESEVLCAKIESIGAGEMHGFAYLHPREDFISVQLNAGNLLFTNELKKNVAGFEEDFQGKFKIAYTLPHGRHPFSLSGITRSGKTVLIFEDSLVVKKEEVLEKKILRIENGRISGGAYLRPNESFHEIKLSVPEKNYVEIVTPVLAETSDIASDYEICYRLPRGSHNFSISGFIRSGEEVLLEQGVVNVANEEVLRYEIGEITGRRITGRAYLFPQESFESIVLAVCGRNFEAQIRKNKDDGVSEKVSAGFEIQFELPVGNHPAILYGTTADNDLIKITECEIPVKFSDCLEYFIDQSAHGVVSGWCFARAGYRVKSVTLKVDNMICVTGDCYDREDVRAHFGRAEALHSGFSLNYNLPKGTFIAEVILLLETGEEILLPQFSIEQDDADACIFCIRTGGLEDTLAPIPFSTSREINASFKWIPALNCGIRKGHSEFSYSDGEHAEESLFRKIYYSKDRSLYSEELREHITDWQTQYHLSPRRANLLKPFAKQFAGKRVLELGCGCGAISRALGEFGANLIAVEGSLRRAAIAAKRCEALENVRVFCDNINNFPEKEAFDFVTLIGVLEYAPVFGDTVDPVQALLQCARSYLKPGGKLIVAIENQLGLKYFCGAKEDHFNEAMIGINDSYGKKTPVTFGKKELEARLNNAGFNELELYFPFPDYKLPVVVIKEGAQEQMPASVLGELISQTIPHEAQKIDSPNFSLQCAWPVVARNGLWEDLAHSFLICASAVEKIDFGDKDVFCWYYSFPRAGGLNKYTVFRAGKDGAVRVERIPEQNSSPAENDFFKISWESESCYDGSVWSQELFRIMNRPGWNLVQVTEWALVWFNALCKHAGLTKQNSTKTTFVDGLFFDATPFNLIILKTGESKFFDLEWNSKKKISLGMLLFRSIFFTFQRLTDVAPPASGIPLLLLDLTKLTAAGLGFHIMDEDIAAWWPEMCELEKFVFGGKTSAIEAIFYPRLLIRK